MTPRGLLHKANSPRISALAFFQAHREYLLNSEVSYATAPIVKKLESGELLPTPALTTLKKAILDHILLYESQAHTVTNKHKREEKPFTATIRRGTGEVALDEDGQPIRRGFDLHQRAIDWIDRRLFEASPDCFGEVHSNRCTNPEHATDIIRRDESIARLLKEPRMAVHKVSHPSNGNLGFGVKVRQSKVAFSRG
jgi:hypothetical protein